jgi:sirohydrochlorin ferrochelatase
MRLLARSAVTLALLLPTAASAQHADHAAPPAEAAARKPQPAAKAGPVGVILIAHGAEPSWNAEVERIAKTAQTGGPLEIAYLMGPAAKAHRFQDAAANLARAGVGQIVVVPLLVSSHSGHYEQIRWLAAETDTLSAMMTHHLEMSGLTRADVDVPLRLARALDDAPQMARVLAERARALATAPATQALFLVGHGPNSAEDYAFWMRNLRVVADSVRASTGFRDVRVDLVRDDAPAPVRAEAVTRVRELIAMQRALTGQTVVVVPILVSKGRVSREKFMADLAGLDVVYSGEPLLPHPELARWIEARVREVTGEQGRTAAR